MPYFDILAGRVAERARALAAAPVPATHRALQQQAEAAAYAVLTGADPGLLARAGACLDALAAQQGRDGLFLTGDNVESPPDSSFTANGLVRLVRVCRSRPELAHVTGGAIEVLRRLVPGLIAGGVHTPNHRWELAAALAGIGDVLGDDECGARADVWLAEGIDLQEDGLYSERSPLYAAAVTNPCLLDLAETRDRPDLVDMVHTNLHAHLLLTDRTGRVETLQSRRQDQVDAGSSMARFAWQYRVLAHRTGCGQCGAAAVRGEDLGGSDVLEAVAGVLLDPDLGLDPPVRETNARTGWTVLEPSGLAIHRDGATRLVARSAPDVATLGRVASGAAANPTFAHLRSGSGNGVWVRSLRLSRAFFGLGPFRAQNLRLTSGRAVLTEVQQAGYYQPTDADLTYGFEGRFASRMGFESRRTDLVTLATEVTVTPRPGGLDVTIDTGGPVVAHALEIGLGAIDGAVSGEVADLGGDRWLALGEVVVRTGAATVRIAAEGAEPNPAWAAYDPGEAYTFLNGTDLVDGQRVYVTTRSPGRLEVRIRVEEQA